MEYIEHQYEEDKHPRGKLLETRRTKGKISLQNMERINKSPLPKKHYKIIQIIYIRR